jgi:DNA polymerase III epsilon subunit-like protein
MSDFVFAFMDCEFGGLDPELHDLTEIAVIVTDYRLMELASAEWKVRARPERVSAEAAEISGYTADAWKDALPVRQVLTELALLLPRGATAIPAGQNVRMDVQFVERAFKQCGIPYPFDYHVIDLATLFYAWSLVAGEPVAALSLRQAATTAGLIDGPVPHRAMADARLTLETFRHFVGRLAPRSPAEGEAPPAASAAGRS